MAFEQGEITREKNELGHHMIYAELEAHLADRMSMTSLTFSSFKRVWRRKCPRLYSAGEAKARGRVSSATEDGTS